MSESAGMLKYVIDALQGRKGRWREISEASDVPYDTVAKIARGKIPEPGVLKTERLERTLRALDEADALAVGSKQIPLSLAPGR